jgi:hypothetical protein
VIFLAAATMWMMTWYVLWPRPAAEAPPDDPVEGLKAGAALFCTLGAAYALCWVLG